MVFSINIPVMGQEIEKETQKEIPQGKIIDVTDFGADPNGGKDNAIAIQEAIKEAKKQTEPVTIFFPKGEYHIYPEYAPERELYISNTVGTDQNYKMKKIGILLENMENVTIDGDGSLFMFHGKMTTFATIDCKNINFKNFSVDFQVPTVIDITVEEVGTDNTAIIYVPECYNYEISGTDIIWKSDNSPYTDKPYWTTKNSMVYTQIFYLDTGLTKRGSNTVFNNNIQSIEDIGNNRLKFTYKGVNTNIKEGQSLQMRPTVRDQAGTFFWKSEDVQLNDLNIYFLHGFGMVGQSSTNLTLNGVHFETPEGSGRTTAGYADFIQMSGCKGDINIVNSTFSNPHDDPINIHGTYLMVKEKIANNKFKVTYKHNETAGFPTFFVGDEVEFMTGGNMIPVENSVAKVIEVEGPTGNSSNGNNEYLTDIIITLDKDMPAEIGVNTHVVENITYTPNVHIKGNVFKETPTRGILVTTRGKVVIEENFFDGMDMAGIYISNDAQGWFESGRVKDVTIQNNEFRRCQSQAIFIEPTNPTVSTEKTVHENINILNNKFEIINKNVLDAKSVKNLTFKGNTINRYDPDIQIVISADNSNLNVGESIKLESTTKGTQLTQPLFKFNGCKNVVLEGNTYDSGLQMNVSLANMAVEDVSAKNEGLVIQGGSNPTPPVSTLKYTSSNPEVATVSSNGLVKAVGYGEAKVFAYSIMNGRRYESDPITIQVSGDSSISYPQSIIVTAENNVDQINDKNEVVNYAVDIGSEEVDDSTITWTVVDPKTGETSDKVLITPNSTTTGAAVTAKKDGVVEIVAKTANGISDSKLLMIHTNKEKNLASSFIINDEAPDKWNIVDGQDAIRILAQAGSLWANGRVTNNVMVRNMGDLDMTTVEATLKVSGKTLRAYDEAGLMFYTDNSNYVIAERKHGNGADSGKGRIHIVTELGGNADENNNVSNIDSEYIYYKLSKSGNEITGSYSTDEANWTKIGTVTNAGLGSKFKIGFIAAGGDQTDTPFVFSELKVNGDPIALTGINMPPAADTVVSTFDSDANTLNAEYNFADSDGDIEGSSIVKWAFSNDENGTYKIMDGLEGATIKTAPTMIGKYAKAIVIPMDSNNLCGSIAYGTTPILITGGEEEEDSVKEVADASLKSVISEDVSFPTFTSANKYYITTANTTTKTVGLNLETTNTKASISVVVNGKKVVNNDVNTVNKQIGLASGINVIAVTVTAPDNTTVKDYRFVVLRKGDNNSQLENIMVDGIGLDGFNPGVSDYEYIITDPNKKTVNVSAITKSDAATTTISVNGKKVDSSNGEVGLQEGTNLVIISVKPETSAAAKKYTIRVKIPAIGNVNLESLVFSKDVYLDQKFNTDVLTYTGKATSSKVNLKAVAEDANATITVIANGKKATGTLNKINTEIDMYKGSNLIKIIVSYSNGAEKIYRITLQGDASVYLSDMTYESNSTTGWGAITKDKNLNGKKISLLNEKKEKVSFDKGMAAHATSNLYYNIEGMEFEKFETFLGVDAEQGTKGLLSFKIYADDKEVFATKELNAADPMVFASINVTGVKKLRLEANKGSEDSNDHADYADAKFPMDLPEKPNYTIVASANDEKMGTVTMDKADGIYPLGSEAILTAKANPGYQFVKWVDENSQEISKSEELVVDVNNNLIITAQFEIKTFSGGNDSPKDSNIVSNVTDAKDGDTVSIDLKEGQTISPSVFKAAAGRDIMLSFNSGDFRLVVNGKDIKDLPEDMKPIDLSVKSLKNEELSDLSGKKDIVQFEINHNGKLPFKATLISKVGVKLANKTLFLNLLKSNELIYVAHTVVNKTGEAAYVIEVGGKYVVGSSCGTVLTPIKKITGTTTQSIQPGKKLKLKAAILPAKPTIKDMVWTTSNSKYATVDKNGTVTAKKAGLGKIVTIKASALDGKGAKKEFKVYLGTPIKKITITSKSKTVKVGESIKLINKLNPAKPTNKQIKWSVSNSKYATVSKNGTVTAKKAGKGKTITVTATAKDGQGAKASYKLNIR